MGLKQYDITKLPIWAQKLIGKLELDIASLSSQLETTREVAAITADPKRSWFSIPGPYKPNADPYHLWMLHDDNPHQLCALNHRDVLFVGRYKGDDR